jgi:hypothetical protein
VGHVEGHAVRARHGACQAVAIRFLCRGRGFFWQPPNNPRVVSRIVATPVNTINDNDLARLGLCPAGFVVPDQVRLFIVPPNVLIYIDP